MLRSLKSRLTLLYVAILGAILLAFAGSIYFTGSRELLGDFEDSVRRQARGFARVFFEDFDQVQRGDWMPLDSFVVEVGASAAVYDAQGTLLYKSPERPPEFDRERIAGQVSVK